MCRLEIAIFSILLSLTTVEVFGAQSKFIELIEKIHVESDSATVFFFGVENEIVSNFSKKRTDITVTFFNCADSQLRNTEDDRFFSNAIFVVQHSFAKSQVLNFSIQKLHTRKFLIVNANNLQDLGESFSHFFKEKKFTRLFGSVREIAYAYLPFADAQVVPLNYSESLLPNALRDLNGYKFRTVAKTDLPRVFWDNKERGQHRIAGYVGMLFKAFLAKHKALFIRTNIKDLDRHFMMAVVNATINNEIDISINAYQAFAGIQLSYPLKLMNWYIVAPVIGHLNPNQYFVRPFSWEAWIGIGLTTFYVIAMDMLRNKFCNRPVRVWESFSQNYLTILARPTERPITGAYRFHSQVLVFSFVLVNFYLVYLTSFLTVYITVKQHKTLQDLIDNQVPVLMVDYEWKLVSVDVNKDLAKIVILVKHDELMEQRNSMKNLNFAYALGNDKAKFFIDLQKYPKYHIIYESLKNYYLGFVMTEHSPFSGILNDFIIDIWETGLMEKWNRDGIALIKSHKLLVLNTTSGHLDQPYPLSMYHLTFAWFCLVIGLNFSVLVFGIEVFIFRQRQKKR